MAIVEELGLAEYYEPAQIPGRPTARNGKEDKKRRRYTGPELLMHRLTAFLEDEDYLSLEEEIGLARTLLQSMLRGLEVYEQQLKDAVMLGQDPAPPPFKPKELTDALETISRLVERQHRMRYSDANLVTVDAAVGFALAVAGLVNQFVSNTEERTAIIEAIRGLLHKGQGFGVDMQVVRRVIGPRQQGEEG